MFKILQSARRLLLLALVLLVLPASSQRIAPGQGGVTFRSRSELVLVPVVVSKGGAHVAGLKKRDFTLRDRGKEQTIAVFEEVSSASPPPAARPANEFTNFLPEDAAPKHLTIFVLDLVNTPFLRQADARDQLLRTLARHVDSSEPKALVTFSRSGVRLIHDFTRDPAVLAAALRKVGGAAPAGLGANEVLSREIEDLQRSSSPTVIQPYAEPTQERMDALIQQQAIQATLEDFRDLARAFEGIPGRKTLVWITAGYPFLISRPSIGGRALGASGSTRFEGATEMLSMAEKTWQLLNAANIAVYPVDARGLFNPGYSDVTVRMPSGLQDWLVSNHQTNTATMQNFASSTGGVACVDRADLDPCFRSALADSTAYYLLGYYLEPQPKPGWHPLEVKTTQRGARLRARSGFFVPEPRVTPSQPDNSDIEDALRSPLDYTAVPMTVRWMGVSGAGAKKQARFQVRLMADAFTVEEKDGNHVSLEVNAVALTDKGTGAALRGRLVEAHFRPESLARIRRDGLTYADALDLAPGEYTVRFIVRDNLSGRLGSVSAPLRVAP
jgi:VWFA-related protein